MSEKSEIFGKFLMKSLRDTGMERINRIKYGDRTLPNEEAYIKAIEELNFTEEQKNVMFNLASGTIDASIGPFLHAMKKGKYSAIKPKDKIDIYKVIPKEIIDEMIEGEDGPQHKKWREKYSDFPWHYQ